MDDTATIHIGKFSGKLAIAALSVLAAIFALSMLLRPVKVIDETESVSHAPIKSAPAETIGMATATKPVVPGTPNLRFLFLGDAMLDRYIGQLIKTKGLDFVLGDLGQQDFYSGYDVVSVNLESAVIDKGAHYDPPMGNDFAIAPESVTQLKTLGINFFNIANNHITDQGERGLKETRENLDSLGYTYSGCPDRKVGDCTARIIEVKGQKIALLGFSMVYGTFDQQKALEAVQKAQNEADLVVINIHWGKEYEKKANTKQRPLARLFIDNGADIIIGHHPHVVQDYEEYQGKPIFYSLGNFIFDQYWSQETQQGMAVSAEYADGKWQYKIINFSQKNKQLSLDGEKTK